VTGVLASLPLPAGTNADSLQWQSISPQETASNPAQLTYVVPSGQIWLMLTISAKTTSIAPGSSAGFVQIFPSTDPGSQAVFQCVSAQSVASPSTYYTTAAIDWNEVVNSGLVQPSINMQLPALLMQPGWRIQMLSEINGAGSVSFSLANSFATAAVWDWDGSSPSGSPGPEVLGPFLYVPGPEPTTV
jgi:hypothetical protein